MGTYYQQGMSMKLNRIAAAILCLNLPSQALADEAPASVVVVQGSRAGQLDERPALASRLELAPLEVPGSVSVVSRELIVARGARTLDEAVRLAVGVVQGGAPGSPSQSSSRGFTGGFVTYLYDGQRVAVPTMSARVQDTWNIERVEVLKGPSSLMAGDGAIGGAINFVSKRPDRATPSGEALLSYGSWDSVRAAVGINRPLGDASAVRLDYSRQQTDGHAHNRQRYDSLNVASTTLLGPGLVLDLSLQLLSDNARPYQGTALVPREFAAEPLDVAGDAAGRVVDRRMARINYNVDDAVMKADSAWSRATLGWTIAPGWKLSNAFSYYTAERDWRNAESNVFQAPRRIVRDLVGVWHDHDVLSNRVELAHQGTLGGMKHQFAAGIEYSRTRFTTLRNFSNGSAAAKAALAVDALQPLGGSYAAFYAEPALYAGAGNKTRFQTRIPSVALYAEDGLWLGERWLLVTGLRQDRVRLERDNVDLNTGAATRYAQRYSPKSMRAGLVFMADASTSLYAQHTSASAPVGSGNLLLLSAANAAFELSKGKQSEIGLKRAMLGGAVDATLAFYRIELDNILSRDASTPTLTVNNGKQSSRGVELSASWRATRQLGLGGNLAVLDAQFDRLIEAGNVSRAGKLPPNVARKSAALWADYRLAALPLSLGASLHYTGKRYANNANTLVMNGYAVADAHATWRLPEGDLSLRVRNLADREYAGWTGANANHQVMLGAPRSVDLTYHLKF